MSDGVTPNKGTSRSADILQFAAKTCILAVVLSGCTVFVAGWIIDRAERSVTRSVGAVREQVFATTLDGAQFWGNIERDLAWAADPANDLPLQRKRKLINDVRVIVARWRPVVEAVRDEIRERSPTDQR